MLVAIGQSVVAAANLHQTSGSGALWWPRTGPAAVALLHWLLLALMQCWPAAYCRHRTAVLTFGRLVAALAPGMRCALLNTSWLVFAALPPVPTLLSHATAAALQLDSAGYCSAPLPVQMLSQGHLAGTAEMLETTFSPLALAYPVAAQLTPPPALVQGAVWHCRLRVTGATTT